MHHYRFFPKEGDLFCRITIPYSADGNATRLISVGVSTIYAGDMTLGRGPARSRLFKHLGIEQKRVLALIQSHGKSVRIIDGDTDALIPGDGALTTDRSIVLSVTVADCLPVYLYDPFKEVFALVHSGWKGTGIAENAVEMMVGKFSCRPGDISAVIGPGIGACCYDVPAERAHILGAYGPGVSELRGDQYFLSLQKANIRILEDNGIRAISLVDQCTSCSSFFGSYRRQGAQGFTRMVAVIGFF